MDETFAKPGASPTPGGTSGTTGSGAEAQAKDRFTNALNEAKAGAQALGKEAQERADIYRDKLSSAKGEWTGQAKERATGLANDGKARASEAIAGLGKAVADNASLIDERVGVKYGDYARSAATSIQDVATRLDAKDLNELAEDAKTFVRTSPGLAVGIAAVAGYMLARLFRGSDD